MNAVIETRGLTKSFGSGAGVFKLDLAMPAGSVFALLGDTGAGVRPLTACAALFPKPNLTPPLARRI